MSKNRKREEFLTRLVGNLDNSLFALQGKTSFSFQFFDGTQACGRSFSGITHDQLIKLCEKLIHYSRESLEHWQRTTIGKKDGHVFERYGSYPEKSSFVKPARIPSPVTWGRFRLESDFRLAGFCIGKKDAAEFSLSENTFYIVFIDPEHKFYG